MTPRSEGLKPTNRLRARSDFGAVMRDGGRVPRPELVLYHSARDTSGRPRVGFAVPRRVGGAVVRNRVRRKLREAVRPLIPRLRACDIVVAALPPIVGAELGDLEIALAEAAARAGLLLDIGGPGE